MDSQAPLQTLDEELPEPVSDQPATTRAAFIDLPKTEVEFSRQDRIAPLTRRGYNTLALPLMKNGRLMAFPTESKKIKGKVDVDGVLIKAIERCRQTTNPSIWITVDPLSTGDPKTGELSNFAKDHRSWMLRNTRGRSVPVGRKGNRPVFSWVNSDYRRFLGDLMVNLAQTQRFQAFVLDLRLYPMPSTDPARWYCCSYDSQIRASEELGLNFEQLLSSGNRSDIRRWQRWVFRELTTLVRYLKSRVRVARYDVFWKVLVDYGNPHDPEESPWVSWLRDGLVEQVIPCFDPTTTTPAAMIQQVDVASGRRRLILPTYDTEKDVIEKWKDLEHCCTTGYAILNPAEKTGAALPAYNSTWEFEGSLEDNPHEAAISLTEYLCEKFGAETVMGRFYSRLTLSLEKFEPEPHQVAKLLANVQHLEEKFEQKAYHLNPDYAEHYREMELLLRLLPTIRMLPEMY